MEIEAFGKIICQRHATIQLFNYSTIQQQLS